MKLRTRSITISYQTKVNRRGLIPSRKFYPMQVSAMKFITILLPGDNVRPNMTRLRS